MNWSVLVGLLALQTCYFLALGPWRARFRGAGGYPPAPSASRQASFVAGVVMLGLALASPLDALVDVSQTAHMIQHLLLSLVAPPLLLMGTPGWLLRPALRWPGVLPVARWATRGRVAFTLGNATFLGWHIPALYDLALRVEPIHILEHVSILVTSTILWWPILSTLDELPGLNRPVQLLYTFLQTLPGGFLGAILGLAGEPLYPSYVLANQPWGASVHADQQVSGLIMWVGANFFWLAILTGVFFTWHSQEAREERAAAADADRALTGGAAARG